MKSYKELQINGDILDECGLSHGSLFGGKRSLGRMPPTAKDKSDITQEREQNSTRVMHLHV